MTADRRDDGRRHDDGRHDDGRHDDGRHDDGRDDDGRDDDGRVAGPKGIDPRGPRTVAAITAVVLAVAVVTGNIWVLAAQVLVFAIGTLRGVQASPYSLVFRWLVRPRLGPPTGLEDPRAPRFAQAVGLLVTGLGLLLAAPGLPGAVVVSAALALVAALLNAVFGLCLGCELYVRLVRLRASGACVA